MTRIVTGLFETHRDVDLVVEHLVQEFAVPRERVQVHAGDTASGEETRSPQDSNLEVALSDLGLTEEISRSCTEGLQRGAILVAAWVDDSYVDRALATYREYGAATPKACEPRGADDLEQQLRVRAYHLWEQAGRPDGRDLEFWHRARRAMTGEDREVAHGSEAHGSSESQYRHHDATPGSAPDRSSRAAVPDTFPASDPMATTAAVGSRAADPAALMDAPGEVDVRDPETVVARFPDQERAKLALEGLVRDVPLDRRCGAISGDDGHVTLKVTAPGADAARVAEMLRRCGGQDC